MSILIAYASNHGQTGRIAGRIAGVLTGDGLTVETVELERHGPWPSPEGHEAVVVAASVHQGRHQKQVAAWVREHRDTLAAVPTALVSVSLSAAEDSDEARTTARACADHFLEETGGWTPGRVELVAGALRYREYDVATRVLMRLIARQHGQPTDPHTDVEFTDWDGVERFAHMLAADLGAPVS